jgi:PhzF family phenazine biosynthesis protein
LSAGFNCRGLVLFNWRMTQGASRSFKQIDVFSSEACRGNPLAVVLDGDGLSDAELQRFANCTNLSETTFLLPPTEPSADYRVRIFTTSMELPFAGHPTLGSCHAWLEAGGQPKNPNTVVQECGAGLIPIRREKDQLAFGAPPLRKTGALDEGLLNTLVRGLRLSPQDVVAHQWLVNGPQWVGLLLRSAEQVLAVQPDFQTLKGIDFGLVGPHPAGAPCQFEVRGFAYVDGPTEDPVTGSLNAGIGQWLIGNGLAPARYVAAQGTALGRAGRVHVSRDEAGQVWVGGQSSTVVDGVVTLGLG